MTRAVPAVPADAPRLALRPRTETAAELPESIEGLSDPGVETAWDAEINRRGAAIEAGTENLEPWEKVRRRIERKILNR